MCGGELPQIVAFLDLSLFDANSRKICFCGELKISKTVYPEVTDLRIYEKSVRQRELSRRCTHLFFTNLRYN